MSFCSSAIESEMVGQEAQTFIKYGQPRDSIRFFHCLVFKCRLLQMFVNHRAFPHRVDWAFLRFWD